MKKLNLSSRLENSCIELPVAFVDTFLPEAPDTALKVYLYLLRAAKDDRIVLSVEDIADLFDVTPNSVLRSLKYWASFGLLRLSFSDGELTGIELCPFPEDLSGDNAPETAEEPVIRTPVPENVQPIFQPKDDRAVFDPMSLSDDPAFTELLSLAEYYLGKPLNTRQHDSLAFCYTLFDGQTEIIEYLLEYCIETGHTSFYYIESVAKGWKDDGLTTLAEIKESTASRNKTVMSVMKALGLQRRSPVKNETDMILSWAKDFDLTLILEACDRTMSNIHEPNFAYVNSILQSWKTGGVKTLSDVGSFEENRKKAAPAAAPKVRPAANSFRNFHERGTDYNSLIADYYES